MPLLLLGLLITPDLSRAHHPGGPWLPEVRLAWPFLFLEGELAAEWRSKLKYAGSQPSLLSAGVSNHSLPPPKGGRNEGDWLYHRLGKQGEENRTH